MSVCVVNQKYHRESQTGHDYYIIAVASTRSGRIWLVINRSRVIPFYYVHVFISSIS